MFREEVVYRRTQFDMSKAKAREHILAGFIIALGDIDEVVQLIKKSKDCRIFFELILLLTTFVALVFTMTTPNPATENKFVSLLISLLIIVAPTFFWHELIEWFKKKGYSKLKFLGLGIFFSLLVFNVSFAVTPNAKNQALSRLDGSAKLIQGRLSDILVNGEAVMGSFLYKTHFAGVIVVNGSAKTMNACFEELEINGNAILENIEIKNTLHINGKAVLKKCHINILASYGKYTDIEVIDSVINQKKVF